MNEFTTYEHAVSQKIEGRWLAARIGLIFFYVCVALSMLLIGIGMLMDRLKHNKYLDDGDIIDAL